MNIEHFNSIINNLGELRNYSPQELEEIIQAYPWFSTARLLYSKKLHDEQHILSQKELKKTAISVVSRSNLYHLLYHEDIVNAIQNTQDHESELKVAFDFRTDKKKSIDKPIKLSSLDENPQGYEEREKDENIDELEHVIFEHVLTNAYQLEENEESPQNDSEFGDWLKKLDQKRFESREKENTDLIDRFIEKRPKITRPQKEEELYSPGNISRTNKLDDPIFITETLAKIYEKQGNIEKAIKTYEKLQLKFPEKKSYFAALIEKLKHKD